MGILSFLSGKQEPVRASTSSHIESVPRIQYEPKPQQKEVRSTWTLQKIGFRPIKDGKCIVCGEQLMAGTLMEYGDSRCSECNNNFFLDNRDGKLPEGFDDSNYVDWLQLRFVETLLCDRKITEEQAVEYREQVINAVQARKQAIQDRKRQKEEETRKRRGGYLKP